jgi:hypothetical protein
MMKRLVTAITGMVLVCGLSGCSMHDQHEGKTHGHSKCACSTCADCHHSENWDGGCKDSCMKCKAMKEEGKSCGGCGKQAGEGKSCSGGGHAHPHPHK